MGLFLIYNKKTPSTRTCQAKLERVLLLSLAAIEQGRLSIFVGESGEELDGTLGFLCQQARVVDASPAHTHG